MLRRSWVEISLDTIAENYRIYKSNQSSDREIMAVVKADAYGHGAVKVSQLLQSMGCCHFAVSNLEEAIELRDAGIDGQILILGYTPLSAAEDLVKYDITQTLLSEDYAEALKDKQIKAHFALDTGMNRIGLNADDPDDCERIIRKYKDSFNLTGMFTHLCVADTPDEKAFTEGQLEKFKSVSEKIKDLELPYVHCMNSAGGLWCEHYGVFSRLGIILYGLKPDYLNTLPEGIKPALAWKSVVSMIKTVHVQETIGYGRSFRVEKDMVVATVPTGYADGYNRMLSNKGKVLINGRVAPIVGRVCMDQMMVDVTGLDVNFEDEVTLLGEGYDADDMAQDIGTIGYEVLCNISKRVTRVYL